MLWNAQFFMQVIVYVWGTFLGDYTWLVDTIVIISTCTCMLVVIYMIFSTLSVQALNTHHNWHPGNSWHVYCSTKSSQSSHEVTNAEYEPPETHDKKDNYHYTHKLYINCKEKTYAGSRACICKSKSLHEGAKYPTTFIVLIALHSNYERIHMWKNFKEILAFVSMTWISLMHEFLSRIHLIF